MYNPLEHTRSALTPRRLVPWAVFTVLLLAGVVAFFVYGDHMQSLMQAIAER